MDFGVAHLTASTMTTTGKIMGTPSYMAPEQITHSKGIRDLAKFGQDARSSPVIAPNAQRRAMDSVNKYLAHACNGTVWLRP